MQQAISISTRQHSEMIDITDRVQQVVQASGVQEGSAVIFCLHTTAGLTINENADPAVRADILDTLDRLVPWRGGYRHTEGNAAAHVKASLLGPSLTVPVQGGQLVLGTWQGIYLAEFDGPRGRRVVVEVR